MVEKNTSREERNLTQELTTIETENRQVEKLIAQYDVRDVQALLDEKVLQPELYEKIIQAWLDRVYATGEYAHVLRDAHIDLFSDHLELQPELPYATIGFVNETAPVDPSVVEDKTRR
jgi:hypothetical protein